MVKNLYYSFLFIAFVTVSAVQLNADNPVTAESEDQVAVVEATTEAVVNEAEASEVTSESTSASSDDEVELTKISVTGSRIKRTDIEGPQPLVVITSDDIDKGGFLSVYEAVASVAQNTGTNATGGIGAFQNAANANSINLRDFGPGVLLI